MPSEVSQQTVEDRAEAKPAKPRRKWLRRTLWTLGVLVVLLLVLIALAPTLISTGPGTRLTLSLASSVTGNDITADDISVGWFSGQRIQGLRVNQPDDPVHADVPLFEAPEAGLASLLLGSRDLGPITVQADRVVLTQPPSPPAPPQPEPGSQPDPQPETRQPNSPPPPRRSEPAPASPQLPVNLSSEMNLALDLFRYVPIEGEPIEIRDLQTRSTVDGRSLTGELQAVLAQGQATGNVRASWDAADLIAEDGTLNLQGMALTADAAATELPIAAIDRLAGQDGKLLATLGDTLSLTAHAERSDAAEQTDLTTEIDAPRLTGRFIGLLDDQGVAQLRSEQPLTLTLTPQAFDAWLASAPGANPGPGPAADQPVRPGPIALSEPAEIRFNLAGLTLAITDGRLDPEQTHLDAELTIPGAPLTRTDTGQPLPVRDVVARLTADSLRQPIQLELTAQVPANDGGDPGRIGSHTRIDHLLGPDAQPQPQAATLHSETRIENLPTALIAGFVPEDVYVAETAGERLSLTLTADYEPEQPATGAVTLDSENLAGRIAVAIDSDGVFRLTEDANVQMGVSHSLTRTALININPWLGQIATAAAPIQLTLRQQDFALPLTDFDLNRVSAQAQLDMPRVELEPAGAMQFLLSALSQANVIGEDLSYGANITPLSVDLDRGALAYDRFTINLDQTGLGINLVGSTNLLQQTIDVRVSLDGQALSDIPALRDVPLRLTGPITSPGFNRDALTQALLRVGAEQGLRELLNRGDDRNERSGDNSNDEEDGGQSRDEKPSTEQRVLDAIDGIFNR